MRFVTTKHSRILNLILLIALKNWDKNKYNFAAQQMFHIKYSLESVPHPQD